jgi:hypothetical protein
VALVWKDGAAATRLSYDESSWIARRHSVANADSGVAKMAAALREMSRSGKHRYLATSKEGVNLPSRVALQNPSDAQWQQTQPASLVLV